MFLLDATKITNFNCRQSELELHLLFWITAAGKNGVTSAKCLANFLDFWHEELWHYYGLHYSSPFAIIRAMEEHSSCRLAYQLRKFGIGCYKQKSKKFRQLANMKIDLRSVGVEQLQDLVGPKTARCFLIHTRPNQRFAGLDVHILRYMRDQGLAVPKSTPSKGKRYLEVEQMFLDLVDRSGKTVAELDLEIWNKYRSARKYKHEKPLAKAVRVKKKKVLEN